MSNSVVLGTANGKQIVAAINPATFSAPLERVRLIAPYRREPPPGFPALDVSHRIGAILDTGMVLRVIGAEADALVAAGAAIGIDRASPAQAGAPASPAELPAPEAPPPREAAEDKPEGRSTPTKKSAPKIAAPPTLKIPS